MVDQPVDQRDHTGGIREHLVPLNERKIRGDDGAFLLITLGDQVEQEISMAFAIVEITDLIDDEQLRVGVVLLRTELSETSPAI